NVGEIIYDAVFTPLLTERTFSRLSSEVKQVSIPAGVYICIAFIYSADTYFSYFQKLKQHIELHHLAVDHTVVELFMPATLAAEQEKEFIVELKIRRKMLL
ncbi:MAG: hypothetical protein RR595_04620, partial [Lysinibacillus sp.]